MLAASIQMLNRFTPLCPTLQYCSKMEVLELNVLNTATAEDFKVLEVIGVGQHGMVVSATCTIPGHPNPEKLYAVKLLFTFMHDFTSAIRNAYENEWAVLSKILPHKNVVRYWAQFISLIPLSFVPHLPDYIRSYAAGKDRSGESIRRKGQFVVFDYHPTSLRSWLQDRPVPLPFEPLFSLIQDLLRGIAHLQQYRVAHLDLKLDNVLISADGRAVLCDFGCSHQFATPDMIMSYHRGNPVGGNKAHLSPDIITQYNHLKQSKDGQGEIDFSQQEAWAVGVLVHEIAMGRHPFVDYPLGLTSARGMVSYALEDLPPLPDQYPKSFRSIARELLHPDMARRISVKEALKQLQLCFPKSAERREVEHLLAQLKAVQLARDLAEQKASQLMAERDEALLEAREARRELKEYSARCKELEQGGGEREGGRE